VLLRGATRDTGAASLQRGTGSAEVPC